MFNAVCFADLEYRLFLLVYLTILTSLFKVSSWVSRFAGIVLVFAAYLNNIWDYTLLTGFAGISIGCALGISLFLVSFWITTPNIKVEIKYLKLGLLKIPDKLLLKTIWQYALLTAIYEELVWRVCIQTIFAKQFGLALSICLTALFFMASHTHRFKNNYFRMLDLGFFSIILGCVFGIWQAFWAVVLIHFFRNALIVTYRYGSN